MDIEFLLVKVLKSQGVIFLVGMLVFFTCYKFSEEIFQTIENQTFGMRDYILSKCELLFYKVDPEHVTYLLLGLTVGVGVFLFSVFTLLGNLILGLFLGGLMMFLGWQIPKPILNFLIERRKVKFQGQMVDGLNLMASGLRAGQSLPQSFGMVVQELPNPISEEFNLVLQQNRLGVSLDEALENMNKRLELEDVQILVSSVSILRETGGNLSETFDTISEVIRERVRLQQKIGTFIARAKGQGIILCLMPFVIMGLFSISDPELVTKMFTTLIGGAALVFAIGLVLLGGFFMMKIAKIKA